MSQNLKVGGLTLKNPVILASGTLGYMPKGLKRLAESGFGAVTSKTLTPFPWKGNPFPRVVDVSECYVINSEGIPNPGYRAFIEKFDRALFKDVPVIASITATKLDEWVELATEMEKAGADAIELNTRCAHPPKKLNWGIYWSEKPERFINLVETLKKSVGIPIWTKIPDVSLAERAGADANVVGGMYRGMLIDIETGKPRLSVYDTGTVTGPAIKPSGIKRVFDAARNVDIDIIASGGVRTGSDVIEYIMAGAKAVELYTILMRTNVRVVKKIIEEVEAFMKKKGFKTLDQIRGIAHNT